MNNFSLSKPLNMAPTGIATFAKTQMCQDIRNIDADIAILGAPSDLAIQGRTGCRLGPRGIRIASTRFHISREEPMIRKEGNFIWTATAGQWRTAAM